MPTEREDFVAALIDADREVAAMGPPPELHDAVRRRLRGTPRGNTFLLPAAVAVAGLAAVLFVTRPEAPEPAESYVRFIPARCAPTTAAPELDLEPGCAVLVTESAVRIVAMARTTLVRIDAGFGVRAGRVRFEPEPELVATPFSVFVSAGRIDALGARFVVEEHGSGGRVHVEQGRVDMINAGDARTTLEAATSQGWGDDDSAAPRTWSADRIDAEVRRATKLRLTGRHRESVHHLERLLASPIGEDAAAVLSYERATLLETKLSDTAGACRQYAKHRARFGRGRYAAPIDAALKRCRAGNFGGAPE